MSITHGQFGSIYASATLLSSFVLIWVGKKIDDVVLIERKELTSGSTWHAAGLLPLFNMSYSVGQLHKYAVNLYKTLEEETGKNVGFSVVSNIRLASTKDRMDEYHQYAGVARTIGVDVKFLKPEQVKEIWPLCHTDDLVGGHRTHVRFGHPSGILNVGAEVSMENDRWVVRKVMMSRSARVLMEGLVSCLLRCLLSLTH